MLTDRNILPEREIVGILEDAAAAHTNNVAHDGKDELHKTLGAIINSILAGGNLL